MGERLEGKRKETEPEQLVIFSGVQRRIRHSVPVKLAFWILKTVILCHFTGVWKSMFDFTGMYIC